MIVIGNIDNIVSPYIRDKPDLGMIGEQCVSIDQCDSNPVDQIMTG